MFSIYKFSEVHALILRILIIYDILFSVTSLRTMVFPSIVFNAVFSFWKAFLRRNSATCNEWCTTLFYDNIFLCSLNWSDKHLWRLNVLYVNPNFSLFCSAVNLVTILGHQNPGSGSKSLLSLKCQIRIKRIRIRNTDCRGYTKTRLACRATVWSPSFF